MRVDGARSVQQSSFTILANGAGDSPPASGLVDYLLARRAARVTTILHPLSREDGNEHTVTVYEHGELRRRRRLRIPSRPPLTFPLDAVLPPWVDRTDGWFAFNNLLCARGLLERRLHRAGTVTYWAVDFVPDRFGAGSPLTRVYDSLDRYCAMHADLRVELSQAALDGRDGRHGLTLGDRAPTVIAPIGAWLDRVPVCPPEAWADRRLVFIGHLVERMGGDTVIEAADILARQGVDCVLDIAGRGPLEQALRDEAERRGLGERVRFHGFISDHRALERLLAGACVALAPYSTRVDSFTRFADPSKLKSYLAAGLPTLLTDVPPNARELEHEAGAEVLADDPAAFAQAIARLLGEREEWLARREAARQYARHFDWNAIVETVLLAAGFHPEPV